MAGTVVLLDADTVAGWRRSHRRSVSCTTPSRIRSQHPDVTVAAVATPRSMALPADEQPAFEQDIVTRAVCALRPGPATAPTAGCWRWSSGHGGTRERVLVVTDRALGGVPVVGHPRRGHFRFDPTERRCGDVTPSNLAPDVAVTALATTLSHRHRAHPGPLDPDPDDGTSPAMNSRNGRDTYEPQISVHWLDTAGTQ